MKNIKNLSAAAFSCGLFLTVIVGCTALPNNPQNVSMETKGKVVEDLIHHKNFIGIFERADELYENQPTPAQALDISGAVRSYLLANARSGPEIYALLKDNGFKAVYANSPEKMPLSVMCKIHHSCDEVVSGHKDAGTLYLYVRKTYDLNVEIKNHTISKVSAHVRTH
ncbi:MAG: hypothetical protein JNM12_13745 [Alphaproteobacteria bacterium]|nr:hypothetical protein [Alphaproteobacteria bacterium]